MRLHVHVEGVSDKLFFEIWAKKFIPKHSFKIITEGHKGKLPKKGKWNDRPNSKTIGLLDLLPAKLKAYEKALNPETDRVVYLIDLDSGDQNILDNFLKKLRNVLSECNIQKTTVEFCIAVHETEAYFLGDAIAIKKAFPSANITILNKYSDNENGTWEFLLEKVLKQDRIDKPFWAKSITPYFSENWKQNKSKSYKEFCEQIFRICGEKK